MKISDLSCKEKINKKELSNLEILNITNNKSKFKIKYFFSNKNNILLKL